MLLDYSYSLATHTAGCALTYGAATWLCLGPWACAHGSRFAELVQHYKLDPSHKPSAQTLVREACFGLLSVAVLTVWDVFIRSGGTGRSLGRVTAHASALDLASPSPTGGSSSLAALALGAVFIGDTHFYCTHRLLHAVPWLYRTAHKTHHLSASPNPLSGLSFHPLESLLYFSSLPLTALVLPLPPAVYNVYKWSLLLAPVLTHCGLGVTHGPLAVLTYDHHVHHRVGVVNFGGLLPWDVLCGTDYASWRRKNER